MNMQDDRLITERGIPKDKIAVTVIGIKEICSGISGSHGGYLYAEIILSSSTKRGGGRHKG